jgi:hypothetical protein
MGPEIRRLGEIQSAGVTEELLHALREYFSDAEINEIAVTVMSYSVFHHWRSSLGEDIVSEDGLSLADPDGPFGRDGFTIVRSSAE